MRVRSVVIISALLLPACNATSPAAEPRFPEWVVYLESDFTLGPRHIASVDTGVVSDAEQCGDRKFDQIWATTTTIVNAAARNRATLEILANVSPGPVSVLQVPFNRRDDDIGAIEDSNKPSRKKETELQDRLEELRRNALNEAKKNFLTALRSPQRVQDVFQSVEALHGSLPERFRRSSSVVAVFVSDMIHYNTSSANQFNAREGQLNMILTEHRRAVSELRQQTRTWWINDRRLEPVPTPEGTPYEVRIVPVERCSEGESLPQEAAPNWTLIRNDVRQFWTDTFVALGAKAVRWDSAAF